MHYWATPLEARLCANQEVALVGAGNSAGQAAVFLAGQGVKVRMLVRRPDLTETMSRYLVDRIESLANVQIEGGCAVSGLEGSNGMLQAVRWRHGASGEEIRRPISHLFLFIGAEPNTDWLASADIKLDGKGFVLTGEDAGGDRHALETSRRGVFAIGDVRAKSIKRVAAAVGEGAQVVAALHSYLARDHRPCRYGDHPGGANSKPLKSKPGATVQPQSVQSPSDCGRLPGLSRHDGLRLFAGREIGAERQALDTSRLGGDFERKRRAGVPMPDLDRIDAVPVRALAASEQKIDRGRSSAAVALPARRESFAEMPALRMRLKVEQPDHIERGEDGSVKIGSYARGFPRTPSRPDCRQGQPTSPLRALSARRNGLSAFSAPIVAGIVGLPAASSFATSSARAASALLFGSMVLAKRILASVYSWPQ